MKQMVLTQIFLVILSLTVFAQNDNKPKVDIKVNKEYDENGNIIRYDSTYTYFYSGNGEIPDSISFNFNFPGNSLFIDPFFDRGFNLPLTFDDFFGFDNKDFFDDSFFHDFNAGYDKLIEDLRNKLDSLYEISKSTNPFDGKKEYKY